MDKKEIITSSLSFLIILMACTQVAIAKEYYVAQVAAGSGDGTSYANRASVETHNAGTGVFADLSGHTVFLSGDFTSQILVRGGSDGRWAVYDGNDGIRQARFISLPNTWNSAFRIDHKDYIELRDLLFDDFSRPSAGGVSIYLFNTCENIRIHDSTFEITRDYAHADSRVIWMDGSGKNIEIYNNRFETSATYDTITFILDEPPGNDLTNISIFNNTMDGCRHDLITFQSAVFSPDFTLKYETGHIRGIRIYDNDLNGIDSEYCRAWDISANSIGNPVSDVYIFNNYWHHLRMGSQIKAVSNVHIYNNIIANHRSLCISEGMSCDGPDIDCLRSGLNSNMESCYWGGGDAMAIRNQYGPPGPIYIYNNLFYNNSRNAFTITNGYNADTNYDVSVSNNLFIHNDYASNTDPNGGNRGNNAPIRIYRYASSTINTCFDGTISFRNNIFYNGRNNDAIGICDDSRTLSVDELNSVLVSSKRIGFGNRIADPLFTDPNNLDFHLKAGSPAIDTGISLEARYIYDHDGISRPQGAAWDIGAYEFKGGSIPVPPTPIPTVPNLISQWKFDEGTGTIVRDSIGGNNGIITGATWTKDSVSGSALSFDGVDDQVRIENSPSLNPGKLTIMLWLKPDSFKDNAGLIAKGDNANRQYWAWTYKNNLSLEIDKGGFKNTVHSFQVSRWQHLAITFDGTKIISYKDGKAIHDIIQASGQILSDDDPLLIGKLPGFATFHGTIDDVRIYDGALSASKIEEIYLQDKRSICVFGDMDNDGTISTDELLGHITDWKAGSTHITDLMKAVVGWRNGC